MRIHICLWDSGIWVIVEFLCYSQLIKICAKGKWWDVAWKYSTLVEKTGLQYRKLQYLDLALAKCILEAGVYCHLFRGVLSSTQAKCSGSTLMSLYQKEGGIGAESEGMRLQSTEGKKRGALVYKQAKTKRKAWRKMTHERLELTMNGIVCMAIRGARSPPRLTKLGQLKGIQS